MTDRSHTRLFILAVLVMSLVATLGLRALNMQVFGGHDVALAAQANRVREVISPAVRGIVLDQQGRVLVGNRVSTDIAVSRRLLRRQPQAGAQVIAALADLLGLPAEQLVARTRNCGTPGAQHQPNCWNGPSSADPVVAVDVDPVRATAVLENPGRFPGIIVVSNPTRTFPKGQLAAQVLGYVAPVTAADVARDPDLTGVAQTGRSGIEAQYDQQLRGTPGRHAVGVNSAGAAIQSTDVLAPISGATVVSTIDAKLQAVVERQLAAAMARARRRIDDVTGKPYRADSGAAVVLDVTNGEVLAMASAPTYDANVWVNGVSSTDYAALTDASSGQPLLSRAIQAQAAPASTFKVVSTAAALNNGFTKVQAIPCTSGYSAGGRYFRNYDSRAYGAINFARAIEVSCDTVYYRVAHSMWLSDGGSVPKGIPVDAIASTASSFGFGRPTGIDLPGEVSGQVSSREWKSAQWSSKHEAWCSRAKSGYPEVADRARAKYLKALAKENCKSGMLWRVGDAVNAAIGQGDTLVTPLQLAVAYAAIANGGTLWRPHVTKALLSADGKPAATIPAVTNGTLPASKSELAYLRDALRGVIDRGTAHHIFTDFPTHSIPLAGKTGTGEVFGKQTTSWFASFAPADHPRYAVVMMVSQGGKGAGTSGRGVKGIYKALFGVHAGQIDPARRVLVGGQPATGLPTISDQGLPVGPSQGSRP